MSQPIQVSAEALNTRGLQAALEQGLSSYFGEPRAITRLEWCPSAYRSSFALEELEVQLNDGTALRLLFKDVGPQALLEDARAAKPAFLVDHCREIQTYRTFLASAQLGTPLCYGTVLDPAAGRFWLFLEHVRA
jgi:hypothetical protein